jgi:hypothetical protein
MRSPRISVVAALACAALLAVGCGVATKPPEPTPADFIGITQELGVRGITARDIVSGDPGCGDRHLSPTAISFTASGLDQAHPVRVYLYVFTNRDAYERNLDDVDSCARSYVSDPATYEKIEVSPYVVAGEGPWGPGFAAALGAALTTAAGSGG